MAEHRVSLESPDDENNGNQCAHVLAPRLLEKSSFSSRRDFTQTQGLRRPEQMVDRKFKKVFLIIGVYGNWIFRSMYR